MENDANKAMQNLADELWRYFQPKLMDILAHYARFYRAKVTATKSGGVIGVTAPYEQEIKLPYVTSAQNLSLNQECVVLELGGRSNAIILGDGKLSNL